MIDAPAIDLFVDQEFTFSASALKDNVLEKIGMIVKKQQQQQQQQPNFLYSICRGETKNNSELSKAKIPCSMQYCRQYQLHLLEKIELSKFERGCEIMELKQNLNLIARILEQIVGLNTFVANILSLTSKGSKKIHFSKL